MIISHRGNGFGYLENSAEALIEAYMHPKSDGIEFDIQLTKDKIPVIFHDDNITERTCSQCDFHGRAIGDIYFQDLPKLLKGVNLPSLECFLNSLKIAIYKLKCSGNRIKYIDAEIKESDTKIVETYELVEPIITRFISSIDDPSNSSGIRCVCVYSSFCSDNNIIKYLSDKNYYSNIMVVSESKDEYTARDIRHSFLDVDDSDNIKSHVKLAKGYFTVNNTLIGMKILEMNPESWLITDYPIAMYDRIHNIESGRL